MVFTIDLVSKNVLGSVGVWCLVSRKNYYQYHFLNDFKMGLAEKFPKTDFQFLKRNLDWNSSKRSTNNIAFTYVISTISICVLTIKQEVCKCNLKF